MNEIGKNLKKVRLLKNLSLKEAGELLGMSSTAVTKYENGVLVPDSQKLISFANAYSVKAISLIKTYKCPNMKFATFRKKKRLTGEKWQLLKDLIQEKVGKYFEVIVLNCINSPNVKLKKFNCNSLEDAEKCAILFRHYIEISNMQPITDLTSVLENLGILIVQIDNPNNLFNGFDGLSEMVENVPVIVLLNGIQDGARQRFTIAHELGHLVLNITNKSLNEEKLCNRFASALLMPMEAVKNEFGSSRNCISFFELVAFRNEYRVSYSAIIHRLKELKIISISLYKILSVSISYQTNNDLSPLDLEVSYQFKKIVYKLESNKIISVNKACELLGVLESEYFKEDYNN